MSSSDKPFVLRRPIIHLIIASVLLVTAFVLMRLLPMDYDEFTDAYQRNQIGNFRYGSELRIDMHVMQDIGGYSGMIPLGVSMMYGGEYAGDSEHDLMTMSMDFMGLDLVYDSESYITPEGVSYVRTAYDGEPGGWMRTDSPAYVIDWSVLDDKALWDAGDFVSTRSGYELRVDARAVLEELGIGSILAAILTDAFDPDDPSFRDALEAASAVLSFDRKARLKEVSITGFDCMSESWSAGLEWRWTFGDYGSVEGFAVPDAAIRDAVDVPVWDLFEDPSIFDD